MSGVEVVNVATGEIAESITVADARASVATARGHLELAAAQIIWQIENAAWEVLGYDDWDQMRDAEYGGAACMVPTGSRARITQRLKEIPVGITARGGEKHLTDRQIADTLGISRSQVQDDLHDNNKSSSSGQSVDPAEEVIDAEIVEDEPAADLTPWRNGGGNPDARQRENWDQSFKNLQSVIDLFATNLTGARRAQLANYLTEVTTRLTNEGNTP